MHILVDQDGVIADWGALFNQLVQERSPETDFPFLRGEYSWDLVDGLDAVGQEAVIYAKTLPGFYRRLKPIPGAIEALNKMVEAGHDVTICTTPDPRNPTCASDKLAWVEHWLGEEWMYRIVLASDKTMCRGDILIDDRPEIKGLYVPTFEHVIFTAAHNTHVLNRRRLDSWRDLNKIVPLEHIHA